MVWGEGGGDPWWKIIVGGYFHRHLAALVHWEPNSKEMQVTALPHCSLPAGLFVCSPTGVERQGLIIEFSCSLLLLGALT